MKNNTYYITHSILKKGQYCLFFYSKIIFGLLELKIFKGYFDSIDEAKERIKLLRNDIVESDL